MTQADLFSNSDQTGEPPAPRIIRPDIVLLPGRAKLAVLLPLIEALLKVSPWRHMQVPGGKRMSAAMTNCGQLGWVSDNTGYRYSATDPITGRPWPAMPELLGKLAGDWAAEAGLSDARQNRFTPDACLINAYAQGAKMGRHRDSDEAGYTDPVVSVSLGATARFSVGGAARTDPVAPLWLHSGDVLVWGRSERLMHHGVGVPRIGPDDAPLLIADKPIFRLNMTFRRAGLCDAKPA